MKLGQGWGSRNLTANAFWGHCSGERCQRSYESLLQVCRATHPQCVPWETRLWVPPHGKGPSPGLVCGYLHKECLLFPP